MINTLYLPELRELLADGNKQELREFCEAMHPARTAEFMEGLTADEAWAVLQHTEVIHRGEIFGFFDIDRQHEILAGQDRAEVAEMVAELAPDDRTDVLQILDEGILRDILQRLPLEERRDYLRLSQYPEGTAGAVMTSEVAKLAADLTIETAISEIGRQSEEYETIYYLYVVDADDHLLGLVSTRQLLAGMRNPKTLLSEIMEADLITCDAMEDQEEVASKVAKLDLLAIPVVDAERKMLGIITHDDVIDVVHEEAVEDAHRSAAVDPLDESYLKTSVITLSWKRGIWLIVLFVFALLTAIILSENESNLQTWAWLAPFIPLVISSGGNTGNQSATLIITALARGHVTLRDWRKIVGRELAMGLILGGLLSGLGYLSMVLMGRVDWISREALVVPLTLLLVVLSGTLTGAVLPLIFARLGLDPALMSNPFVAGIVDIVGILIYMYVTVWLLGPPIVESVGMLQAAVLTGFV